MLAVLTSPVSASADSVPTAAVISPTSGSQVAGFVTVDLAGTATDDSDPAQRLQLYVDNVFQDEQACVDRCCVHGRHHLGHHGLVGTHLLQARLVTSSTSVLSAAASVQVGDAPAAAVTSPADGASVRGKVTVSTAGTLDALQPDAVQSLQLLVDGTAVASSSCAVGVKVCLAGLVWNSTGVQGSHQLQVRMTSVKGQTALSGAVNVAGQQSRAHSRCHLSRRHVDGLRQGQRRDPRRRRCHAGRRRLRAFSCWLTEAH